MSKYHEKAPQYTFISLFLFVNTVSNIQTRKQRHQLNFRMKKKKVGTEMCYIYWNYSDFTGSVLNINESGCHQLGSHKMLISEFGLRKPIKMFKSQEPSWLLWKIVRAIKNKDKRIVFKLFFLAYSLQASTEFIKQIK